MKLLTLFIDALHKCLLTSFMNIYERVHSINYMNTKWTHFTGHVRANNRL